MKKKSGGILPKRHQGPNCPGIIKPLKRPYGAKHEVPIQRRTQKRKDNLKGLSLLTEAQRIHRFNLHGNLRTPRECSRAQ